MITHIITRQVQDETKAIIAKQETVQGDSPLNLDVQLGSGLTDHLIKWGCIKANILSFVVKSDQALTIKTNDSGSPQETIVLVAGEVKIWTRVVDLIAKCPFSADVTALYVTTGGSATNFQIRALANNA